MDIVSSEKRSDMMSNIRSKNTKPEIELRKFLFSKGFRFKIHVNDLPGHPDIVLPKYKAAIFVHGCFWHHHIGCKYGYVPKTRTDFWLEKFEKNIERDTKALENLNQLGWRVHVVWECELRHEKQLTMNGIANWIKNMQT